MKKLRNFTLTWSREGKINDKPGDMTFSKEFRAIDTAWQGVPASLPLHFLEQNFVFYVKSEYMKGRE